MGAAEEQFGEKNKKEEKEWKEETHTDEIVGEQEKPEGYREEQEADGSWKKLEFGGGKRKKWSEGLKEEDSF